MEKQYAHSHYLSLEASQERLLALLNRIEQEARKLGAYNVPDFYRLPASLKQEVLRRLLCPS